MIAARRTRTAGAAHLHDAIDTKRTGDKVAFPDPAAVPLGTDDEAAGSPPSSAAVEQAMRTSAKTNPLARRHPVSSVTVYMTIVAAIAAVIACAAWVVGLVG